MFVLCKTSNPSSADFQTLQVNDGRMLYEHIAKRAQEQWNTDGNMGLVIGATDVEAMRNARAAAPDLWILAPGVGAQVRAATSVSRMLKLDIRPLPPIQCSPVFPPHCRVMLIMHHTTVSLAMIRAICVCMRQGGNLREALAAGLRRDGPSRGYSGIGRYHRCR